MINSDLISFYAIVYWLFITLFTLADLKYRDRVIEIQRFLFSTIGKLGILLILILAVCFCFTAKGLLIGKSLVVGACAVWVYRLLWTPEQIGFKINDIKVSFYSTHVASLHIGSKLREEACEKVAYQLRNNGVEVLILKSNLLARSHRHHFRLIKRLNEICYKNQWTMDLGNEEKLGPFKKLMIALSILKTHKLSKKSHHTINSISATEGIVTIKFLRDV
ncbi:hypothetical protein BIZ38_18485 [Pseudoalteromonas sp. BZK2]|uniref:hypothetical protein n=1 Tax=Pseudoalteromonas sp. BZK2 TaxID=1904458 RepID=UPI0016540773|nr:hypothetical protein [Pseudoalteromonas sp. BZK2]MBC7010436.1 hypothetical protein [Pseudoalteromonas sp. BZK2]